MHPKGYGFYVLDDLFFVVFDVKGHRVDFIGLKCILVYYPGHLATAVCFTEHVNGDYIQVGGCRYVVCDPTYIGASVGHTMPNMDNSSANVIVLR